MAKIDLTILKQLREETGVGMQDAQSALEETAGDIVKAKEILRKKGAAKADKKSTRTTSQGLIESYLHAGGKVGVLVEVNCETDFVAKTEDFKNFVHDLSLQVAAAAPQYVTREDVPAEVIAKEKEIAMEQLKTQGKPEAIAEKIVTGKLEKFYEDNCLLEQVSIKDSKLKINQMLNDLVNKLGENIKIRRFVRYQLGE